MKPIFIFSLPRAGSTLVQRILGCHSKIHTVAEPWILIPGLYALRKNDTLSRYGHSILELAIKEFCQSLANGEADYLFALGEFARILYRKVSSEDKFTYFVDKTPRYHIFCNHIIKMFPEGKFIFLWRNPLSVISSIVETWRGGKWNLSGQIIDLYDGFASMMDAYITHKNHVLSICYEDIVNDPDSASIQLFNYLELETPKYLWEDFKLLNFTGSLGDPTRGIQYDKPKALSVDKWKQTIDTPIRKAWCRRYIRKFRSIDEIGYSSEELLADIDSIPINHTKALFDIIQCPFILTSKIIDSKYIKLKLSNFRKDKALSALS